MFQFLSLSCSKKFSFCWFSNGHQLYTFIDILDPKDSVFLNVPYTSFVNFVILSLHGTGTATEWSSEGKRLVSLTPRLVPQTVFTAKATHTANAVSHENSKLPAKKCTFSFFVWPKFLLVAVWPSG